MADRMRRVGAIVPPESIVTDLTHPPFAEVLRIAVLRGGGLGDLVFALPAIDALAAAYPEAEIVVLGTPAGAALLAGRPGPVTRAEVLPHAEGVHDARGAPTESPGAFLARMAAQGFDLACQLHGGGRYSNPFVLALGARHTIGTRTADAAPLERTIPYLYYQHEVARWLETVGLAGAGAVGTEPRLALRPDELDRAETWRSDPRPLVVVHPGASDPRRRWPAERFAEVARSIAADGARVAVVGDGEDAAVADDVARACDDAVFSTAGRLTLRELLALLAAADVVVANDSGPRHLAQAVGTPTVGIFWVGNLINGGPSTRTRHRVQIGWSTTCSVCGRDTTQVGWTAPRCEHDASVVAGVTTEGVLEDLRELLALRARTAPARGTG